MDHIETAPQTELRTHITWAAGALTWAAGALTWAAGALLLASACGASVGDGNGQGQGQADAGAGGNGNVDGGADCASVSFPVTETQEAFRIPNNVTFMHVKAWGAGGNGEGFCAPGEADSEGGLGGYSEAVFPVRGGDELLVMVGKRGRAGISGEDELRFGFGGWGGGGLTGIFTGGDLVVPGDNSRALIIAGGGGSAGLGSCDPGGTGNHPAAGGANTMQGALGDQDINGGGGGYIGGAGGTGDSAGNGGAGFIAPAAVDSRMLHAQPGVGTPPNADDPDYMNGAGGTEQSGLLVMHFTCEAPEIE